MPFPQHNAQALMPQPGDTVFSASDLINDGSHPEYDESAVMVTAGSRGVLLMIGHPEDAPETDLFLVRFEDAQGRLGPPIGCWDREIVVTENAQRPALVDGQP